MAGNAWATYDPWFRIPLTSTGQQQAREAGQRIKDIIRDETLYVYVSPYLRATQTLDYVREALDPRQVLVVREEPRVSEQQFGNFQAGLRRSQSFFPLSLSVTTDVITADFPLAFGHTP